MRKELLKAEQVRLNMHRRFVDLLTEERLQSTKHADETARLRAENDELRHRVETLRLLHSNNLTPEGKQAQDRPEAELALEEIRALRIELATVRRLAERAEQAREVAERRQQELEMAAQATTTIAAASGAPAHSEAPALPPATPHAAQGEASASRPSPVGSASSEGAPVAQTTTASMDGVDDRAAVPTSPEMSEGQMPLADSSSGVAPPTSRADVHDSGQPRPAVDEVLRLRQQIESNAKQQRRMRLRDRRMFRIRLEVARMTAAAATVDLAPLPPPPPKSWFYLDPARQEQGPFTESQMATWFHEKLLPSDLPIRVEGSTPDSHAPLSDLGVEPPFVRARRVRSEYLAAIAEGARAAAQRKVLSSDGAAVRIQSAWRRKAARDFVYWSRYEDENEGVDPVNQADRDLAALAASYASLWAKVEALESIATMTNAALADKKSAELAATNAQVQQANAVLQVEAARRDQAAAEAALEQAREAKDAKVQRELAQLKADLQNAAQREADLQKALKAAEDAAAASAHSQSAAAAEARAAERAATERADSLSARLESVAAAEREVCEAHEQMKLKELLDEMEEEKHQLEAGFRRALKQQAEEMEALERRHEAELTAAKLFFEEECERERRSIQEERDRAVEAVREEADRAIEAGRIQAEEAIEAARSQAEEAREAAREADAELQALAQAVLASGGKPPAKGS